MLEKAPRGARVCIDAMAMRGTYSISEIATAFGRSESRLRAALNMPKPKIGDKTHRSTTTRSDIKHIGRTNPISDSQHKIGYPSPKTTVKTTVTEPISNNPIKVLPPVPKFACPYTIVIEDDDDDNDTSPRHDDEAPPTMPTTSDPRRDLYSQCYANLLVT